MTFEEWYEANVKYMTAADFKPWMSEAWDAAVLAERERWITRDYYKGREEGQLYEREECAKVCEKVGYSKKLGNDPFALECAVAIRARSEK